MDQRIRELLEQAQQGVQAAREQLIRDHRQFVYRAACQTCNRQLDWKNDDELSVGLIAFDEAIDRYDPDRGASFESYARQLIKSRIRDFWRKEQRFDHASLDRPVAGIDDDSDRVHPAAAREAAERFDQDQELRERSREMSLFEEEIGAYGIDLDVLEEASPTHQRRRQRLTDIALHLAREPELLSFLQRRRQMPVSKLMEQTGASRKVLEQGRRYIVALVVIMTERQFGHLRAFLQLPDLGDEAD